MSNIFDTQEVYVLKANYSNNETKHFIVIARDRSELINRILNEDILGEDVETIEVDKTLVSFEAIQISEEDYSRIQEETIRHNERKD